MREKKFRGIHNGGWKYGFLSYDYKANEYTIVNSQGVWPVIPGTVGQEIDNYDKDGKMIHKGDICQFSDWKPKEIIWNDGRYWLGDTLVICCSMECANMKIIGNKTDDPKLLEEDNDGI